MKSAATMTGATTSTRGICMVVWFRAATIACGVIPTTQPNARPELLPAVVRRSVGQGHTGSFSLSPNFLL
jgi:hypothetical protein